ncbi:MATE family efflux transporter [Falsibacillus pallidus]|uniref:Probable multidrug resistance protein NorM n=1 Tax=Falsibacillus pallidus TaxID=493781 RepID=A0A370GIS1_9BACI|nr:MATE family efflux transporter [Falsibacillus pallidus]RDI43116.1 MATE family multidrug resistance protein [Falsibacillus pallidus]
MYETHTLKDKIQLFIKILIPILVTQLAMFSMNFLDTMMSGQYSAKDLAGVAIGSSLWVPVFTGLSGILLAITPIVAQLAGAKNKSDVSSSVIQGIYVAIVMAILVLLIGSVILDPILDHMNVEKHVRVISHDYLTALSAGMIPLFIYNVLRSFIDALGKTRVSMAITLLSLPINAFFNYVFIFGKFGFPELGGVGAGYASAITYWTITGLAMIIIHLRKPFSAYKVFSKTQLPSFRVWKEIFKIGIPIGLSIFFETSIFSAVTLLMSEYSTLIIASHQAALNFASFLYMIPLSISMGLTIVVGFEVGAKRYEDARKYSWIGLVSAIAMAMVCGIFLFGFKDQIASIYSGNKEVIALTSHFLLYAVFFQLSDAIQAPVQGALRGYKDVNITFIMALVSYWVIGLPAGYLLANHTSFEAYGYWLGLIIGLAAGAVTLSARLHMVQKRMALANE